jgi:hypothetical protein
MYDQLTITLYLSKRKEKAQNPNKPDAYHCHTKETIISQQTSYLCGFNKPVIVITLITMMRGVGLFRGALNGYGWFYVRANKNMKDVPNITFKFIKSDNNNKIPKTDKA